MLTAKISNAGAVICALVYMFSDGSDRFFPY